MNMRSFLLSSSAWSGNLAIPGDKSVNVKRLQTSTVYVSHMSQVAGYAVWVHEVETHKLPQSFLV